MIQATSSLHEHVHTLGQLRESPWRSRSIRDELRENLIAHLSEEKPWLLGIVGYDDTVIPQIEIAILSKHNFILLGLRGQAKTRIVRQLTLLLDEYMPAIDGSPLRDDPFQPLSPPAQKIVDREGDATPITWVHRSMRYHEKLATPDVTIADMIGDIDPIKAAREKMDLGDPDTIHFGIIPRSNRGIFVLNELPDLQPRIQVGLLNIMEEKDIQVRGFPVRVSLDLLLSFTANPEDYTNRGNIITPLKDRIDSQIITHYPKSLDDAMTITAQEAWTDRPGSIELPRYLEEMIEEIAFVARESDYVDQASGVSQRLPIRARELVLSSVERRVLVGSDKKPALRLVDLAAALPAVTGRVELVYEGEQEGPSIVANKLIGRAMLRVFQRYFPPVYAPKTESRRSDFGLDEPQEPPSERDEAIPSEYREILGYFSSGGVLELRDNFSGEEYQAAFGSVPTLQELVLAHLADTPKEHQGFAMEWVLESLHQVSLITKQSLDGGFRFADMLAEMLG